MSNKDKFLPLIQQRNKKRNNIISKINDSFLRDLSSSTLKNYQASFEDKNHGFEKLTPFKDNETISLAKKYIQKLQHRKKSLGKIACIKKISRNQSESQKSKMSTLGQEQGQRQRQKLMKIQALIKSLSLDQNPSKSQKSLDKKDHATIAHLPSEEMRRMKSILFSNERRKVVLKSKQDILDKYSSLKNKLSKSLQSDIKVNQYKSGRQSKEKSAKIYNKLLTEQYTVALVAKNPQQSYKYEKYDDGQDKVFKTLQKPKYRYFQTPQKNSIKILHSPTIKSQKCSKKNFSYRLDTFEPWQNNIQSDQVI